MLHKVSSDNRVGSNIRVSSRPNSSPANPQRRNILANLDRTSSIPQIQPNSSSALIQPCNATVCRGHIINDLLLSVVIRIRKATEAVKYPNGNRSGLFAWESIPAKRESGTAKTNFIGPAWRHGLEFAATTLIQRSLITKQKRPINNRVCQEPFSLIQKTLSTL